MGSAFSRKTKAGRGLSNGAAARFQWVTAPTREELTQLAHTIAQRIGHFLEREGLLERDAEHSYLA